ncbi:MAG: Hsp20/alpha crystallin family protein [Parcubacteria group bacterium]|nr:Hsp20/alpha crystallin family protein [Parcubacteria group bacterium]
MPKRSFFQLVTGRDPEIEEYKNVLAPPAAVSNNPKTNHRAVNVPFETESAEESEPAAEEGQLTIDVYQTTDEMVIKSTIAGVKQEDLEITIAADMVTVQGVRKKDEGISPEDYYYQELYWGPFSRSVILPHEIDTEGARAALKDGILTIRLPKFERGRTKKLRINSA